MSEIRFTQRDAPWDAGDVVEVSEEQAAKLIRHGVAEEVETVPTPEPVMFRRVVLPEDDGGRG